MINIEISNIKYIENIKIICNIIYYVMYIYISLEKINNDINSN